MATKANKEAKGKPFIELRKIDNEWHWIMWAKNGRPMLVSARGYEDRHDARRAIDDARRDFSDNATPLLAAAD